MAWYFDRYEGRTPPAPVPHNPARELAYQTLAVAAMVLGAWYLWWRWTDSLNVKALWFAIPLVVAETLAYFGSLLFFLSIWRTRDTPVQPPPRTVNDILAVPLAQDRPLIVDVFFPTYNEDVELVRLSIRDGKKMTYPHPIDLRIHALDDGRRPAMKKVADEEGVGYITRTNNIGYKAGNMRNALEQTQGDVLVICDADTRPFPQMLERTLGYFRDPQVAWVQSPQWFYDLDEGTPLPKALGRFLGPVGRGLGWVVEKVAGPIHLGRDPLANDPQMFFDVIQRRRNWCNASFCCGAGSLHRREAVMEAALKAYGAQVETAVAPFTREVTDPRLRGDLAQAMSGEIARATELTPYKFHVSEDIYTSIVLHSDKERQWKSVFHPEVLSKMLSPQDLLAWTIQRFKYAGGTLDIFKNDNPLRLPGLSGWQKLMYGTTLYSYLAPLWTLVFLAAPILYLFSGVAPVATYDAAFYSHLLPFLVINKLAFMVGTWGVNTYRGEQYYLGFFWLNLRALWDVARGKTIKFHVTPKTREAKLFLNLVWPHLTVIGLTVLGLLVMGLRIMNGATNYLPPYVANVFWSANNIFSLSAIVLASVKKPVEDES
ncbi:MAG TPA: cellulose synthase catalytic subunit [Myxococcaceae bacterium]|nr:cellulose synthase catalytic subunit [Myxococcaceae bacterium]